MSNETVSGLLSVARNDDVTARNDSNDAVRCDLCPRGCRINPGGTGFCGARGVVTAGDESDETVYAGLLRSVRNDSDYARDDGAADRYYSGTAYKNKVAERDSERTVVSLNYGRLTSVALDPIEKKPLRRFHPGSMILSVGSFGCNLNCPWCQNHHIARAMEEGGKLWEVTQEGNKEPSTLSPQKIDPEALVKLAEDHVPLGNIGVAFTYNEPLISYEYVSDTAKLLKERGLKSVLVTNGYASPSYLESLLPLIDAMNIDLKSIKNEFYRDIGGDVETVKRNIKAAASRCHVEITCLLIEGKNDSEDEMREMTDFIASASPDIPLHISRCFPRYKYAEHRESSSFFSTAGQKESFLICNLSSPTGIHRMERFKEIADEKLKHVYLGNV